MPERLLGGLRPAPVLAPSESPSPEPHPDAGLAGRDRLEPLIREWLLDLQVMGRSQRTIQWYTQKMECYLHQGEAETPAELTAFELKRFLAAEQGRELSENTVHGHFQVLKSFANWACREGYPVDPALLRVRAPKVAQKEMESYMPQQIEAILREAKPSWPRMAVAILLGTGMRVGEMCALTLDDVEDDGEAPFLKIKRARAPSSGGCRSAASCGGS